MIIPAIFTSKIIYCLHVTGTIWGLTEYGEQELLKMSCPKSIMQKLQSCQRVAVAMLFPDMIINWETRTATLLSKANILSVHQIVAAQLIRSALNAMNNQKPEFLNKQLVRKTNKGRNKDRVTIPRCRLNLKMESFHNQAVRLINMLPTHIVEETSLTKRKRLIKDWVSTHITVHPGNECATGRTEW